jgi:hypothetical protein
MPHCDRGPERDRPVLYWRYAHAETVPLRFFRLPGVVCETEARYSEVLLLDILCEQWERDRDLIEAHRGFVHIDDLADRYARRAGRPIPTRDAIRQYFYRLHARMDRAASALGLEAGIRLVESKRGVGYRIAGCGLRIEDDFRSNTAWC